MELDAEMWDNKTITSGLKNYFRSAHLTSYVSSLKAIMSLMLETRRVDKPQALVLKLDKVLSMAFFSLSDVYLSL